MLSYKFLQIFFPCLKMPWTSQQIFYFYLTLLHLLIYFNFLLISISTPSSSCLNLLDYLKDFFLFCFCLNFLLSLYHHKMRFSTVCKVVQLFLLVFTETATPTNGSPSIRATFTPADSFYRQSLFIVQESSNSVPWIWCCCFWW